MNFKLTIPIGVSLLLLIFAYSSCTSYNELLYVKNIPDSLKSGAANLAPYQKLRIQPDDILSITITTIDPQQTALLNQGQTPSAAAAANPLSGALSTPVSGYLVDEKGEISLPIIGTLKVAGLTTLEARDLIHQQANIYFNDSNVQVRFANFRVTVLGEVLRPATYVVPNEKITVFDALGLAGDITIYGKRDNVLLMRDSLNTKYYYRLNLNSSDIFHSPYFYLRQNDVIYVEPNKSKLVASDATQTRFFTIGAAVLTAIALILIRIK